MTKWQNHQRKSFNNNTQSTSIHREKHTKQITNFPTALRTGSFWFCIAVLCCFYVLLVSKMSKSRNLRITFSTMCHFKPNENDQKSAKNKLLTFFVFPLQMAQMKVIHRNSVTFLAFFRSIWFHPKSIRWKRSKYKTFGLLAFLTKFYVFVDLWESTEYVSRALYFTRTTQFNQLVYSLWGAGVEVCAHQTALSANKTVVMLRRKYRPTDNLVSLMRKRQQTFRCQHMKISA